ncbi:MAG: flavodoxin [Promethearchaeota archaeon CR_4]|nr:MAG: flavodoxin [Candidatus Lokiarchaeota archaeon CR_4]
MSKKKKVGIACVIAIIGLISAVLIIIPISQREVITPLETVNASGTTGRILVIYHPGLSSFPSGIARKFAEGAASKNWIIDLSTVSHESPSTVTMYNLIVILSPVYGGKPQTVISTYLTSVDFQSKPVVAILTYGMADPVDAMTNLTSQITAAHGTNLLQATYLAGVITTEQFSSAYQLGANQSLIDAI